MEATHVVEIFERLSILFDDLISRLVSAISAAPEMRVQTSHAGLHAMRASSRRDDTNRHPCAPLPGACRVRKRVLSKIA